MNTEVVKQKTVMIVEDNADTSFLVSTILARQGIRTTVACGGAEAWFKLDSGELPDLIMTDMRMPGMSGEDLVDRLHQDSRMCGIPVIVSSARTDIFSQLENMGVQGCLSKPYSMAALVELVNRFIRPVSSAVV